MIPQCPAGNSYFSAKSGKVFIYESNVWCSPLCSKEDVTRDGRRNSFHSFLLIVLVPSASTSSTSQHRQNRTCNSESRPRFNALWLNCCPDNSLRNPMRAKSVSYFHCVKQGILGIGTVQGFGTDWVDGRSIAWLEWVPKGVLHGSPWECYGSPVRFFIVNIDTMETVSDCILELNDVPTTTRS